MKKYRSSVARLVAQIGYWSEFPISAPLLLPTANHGANQMPEFFTVDPKTFAQPKLHGLLLSAVAPRPIAFASTIDEQGRVNLAPFSFFNVFSSAPPIAIFSPALRGRDGTGKHTLANVKAVPEVVINIVNYAMVQQMSLASAEFAEGENEFVKAGFTELASETIRPPRVLEAPVQLECRVNDIIALGTQGGAGNLVICEVLRMHINTEVLNADGRIDQHKIDLVARLGNDHYVRASGAALFDVAKPGSRTLLGFDALPSTVKQSTVLSGNNLGQLANAEHLPDPTEVAAMRLNPVVAEIVNVPSAEKKLRLHGYAKTLLEAGLVADAWQVLLNDN